MTTLNLVEKKKNSISLSNFQGTTTSTLQDIHTGKESLIWDVPADTSAWIKFTSYEILQLSRVRFTYTGTATTFRIEKSINNFEWEIISANFAPDPDEDVVDVAYTTTEEYVFIRIVINAPSSFIMTGLEIYSNVEVDTSNIISHNFYSIYSEKERTNNPFFPSIMQNMFEMWEDLPNLDLKLFDASLYTSAGITKVDDSAGTGITLIGTGITPDSSIQYVWDFDDPNVVFLSGTDEGFTDISYDNLILNSTEDFSDFSADALVGKILEVTSGSLNKFEYVITAHTGDAGTNTITVDSELPFAASETEMDWQIKDTTDALAIANPNIITTINPLALVSHTYNEVGEYTPRLVINHSKYIFEFTSFFERT